MTEPDSEIPLGPDAEIAEGKGRTFFYRDNNGLLTDAFVIRFHGALHAYRNQCRHVPLTLDYGDGDFFTDDGTHLLCRNHGAIYEPDTGLCVAGPCAGAALFSIPVEVRDGQVIAKPGEAAPEPDLE